MRWRSPPEGAAQRRGISLSVDRRSLGPRRRRSPRAGKADVRSADSEIKECFRELSGQQVTERSARAPGQRHGIRHRCRGCVGGRSCRSGMWDHDWQAFEGDGTRWQSSGGNPFRAPGSSRRRDGIVPSVQDKRNRVRVSQFDSHRELVRSTPSRHAIQCQDAHLWRCSAARHHGQDHQGTCTDSHDGQSTRCRASTML